MGKQEVLSERMLDVLADAIAAGGTLEYRSPSDRRTAEALEQRSLVTCRRNSFAVTNGGRQRASEMWAAGRLSVAA